MKKCAKCGETKPLVEFHKEKNGKNGRRSDCKVCSLLRVRRHQQENEAHYKKYRKQYYQENKEFVLVRQRLYDQENKEYRQQAYQERKAKQPGCIYQIVNSINGKVYIGETIKGELRWQEHLRELRGNRHPNPNLQVDFNKIGEDAFEWSIIQEFPKDKEMLKQEETKIIQKFLSEGKNLYNVQKTLEDK